MAGVGGNVEMCASARVLSVVPNLLLAKVHSVSHFLKILKANKLLVKNGHQASAQWAPLYRGVNPAKGNVTLTSHVFLVICDSL